MRGGGVPTGIGGRVRQEEFSIVTAKDVVQTEGADRAFTPWKVRLGISAIFFVNGFLFANWAPRIPEVRAAVGIDEADLGLALLALAGGGLAAMVAVGRLADRVGARPVLAGAVLVFPLTFAALAFAGEVGFVGLASALFVFGAAAGGLDVVMNVQGAAAERASRRAIFASFHGVFSLGVMAGAGTAAAMVALGASIPVHFLSAALFALVVGLLALRPQPEFARGEAPDETVHQGRAGRWRAGLPIGFVAFCALLGEGAVADWSAVLLVDYRGETGTVAGLAFAAFAGAMALGRFFGDAVIARFGRRAVVAVGGCVAAAGLSSALIAGSAILAAAGFALMGLGISCMFPALVAAAVDRAPDRAGAAVAAVSTIGYLGFLLGPPAIGFTARAAGLPAALTGIVVLLALAAAVALVTLGPRRPAGRDRSASL
jgi:MFS family permease